MKAINDINWLNVSADMVTNGYALVPGVLTADECEGFINEYSNDALYRKTIIMEHHQYGLGEYKYFKYPLPALVQQLRETVYPELAPVANNWMFILNKDIHFPATLAELLDNCHVHGQNRPTPLILKYTQGGFNALHQDIYGEVFFPMQAVLFLNEPGEDYEGGEFVLIEQKPRAQSRAIVLKPKKGDMLLFTTSFRPQKTKTGHAKVNMKHGVAEVTSGDRHTLGIIFHDGA